MRISGSEFSVNLKNQLEKLSSEQFKYLNRLSTGQRISRVSEDPLAASRVIEMEHEKRNISQYSRNIGRAEAVSNLTYSGIKQMQDIQSRVLEITSIASSGLQDDASMASYGKEVNNLIEQALNVGNTTYLGEYLFSGDETKTQPFAETRDPNGNVTNVTYQGGTTASAAFNISSHASMSPFQDYQKNQAFQSMMSDLISLRDALDVGDEAQVRALQPDLQAGEDSLIAMVGDVSAKLLRIELSTKDDKTRFADLESMISKEVDADIADSVTRLSRVQTALQAAMQSGSQILRQSLLDFI